MKERKFKLNISDKEYEVEIRPQGKNLVKIRVAGEEFDFQKTERQKQNLPLAKASMPKKNFSEKKIVAPISGTVSEIFVQEGEQIVKDKKVILLSAMKMENEIVADFAGKIKKIRVEKEQNVKEGELLITME